MLRPLAEPLRTWESRRGGCGVDVAGGRLRRPWWSSYSQLPVCGGTHRTRQNQFELSGILLNLCPGAQPALKSDHCPHTFDHAERPGSSQPPIDR